MEKGLSGSRGFDDDVAVAEGVAEAVDDARSKRMIFSPTWEALSWYFSMPCWRYTHSNLL